ncbi:hypothetical protein LZ198_27150 [Myxococcus sp. K15C18031901]|uniref:hypothetical protein n=1 Tax=Myxococcus dinghuensis TaxID=2906761 RepID=UPI0020A7CF73|nr:hypothetical protein [Myxococcus dinghuensis]MCP3102557.1 hypothetical protein [Myxococcus dinghuensis]
MTQALTLNPPSPRHPALRSAGAILAGLVLNAVLASAVDAVMHATGVFPPLGQPMSHALFALALAYRLVFTVGACALTARLARRQPLRHALILGGIGMGLALLGAVATWGRGPEFGPAWYPLSLVATALPCAWLGGRLAAPRPPPARHS